MSNVTPIGEWKAKNKPTPLELPSGNKCLVQPVGIDVFIKQGIIPNSLLGIVQKALQAGQAGELDTDEFMGDALEDPEKIQSIFEVADRVAVYCVVDPPVHPIPPPTEDGSPAVREEDKLYVDEIDLDDKLFILNFAVGGSRDLEAFRTATGGGVGSVPDRQQVPVSPEQSP